MTIQIEEAELIDDGSCPSCKSDDLHTFHDPVLSIAHMTCNLCGANWQEETTSWAEQDSLRMASNAQISP